MHAGVLVSEQNRFTIVSNCVSGHPVFTKDAPIDLTRAEQIFDVLFAASPYNPCSVPD
jgi:hypothetical protein